MMEVQVGDSVPAIDPAAKAELTTDIRALLGDAAQGLQKELKGGTEAVIQYTAERAAILSVCVGQPGFERAVTAERDNVALFAALEVGRQASGADARILGIIQSALFFGAKRLALAIA